MAKRTGLGKGLDALFLDNSTEDGSVTTLKLSEIEPNKHQPRIDFAEEALRELADSIRQHGILQPLVVRPMDEGGYQIVAGERRWRAARMAGLYEIPVVIRQLRDDQTLEIAIIENLQREDLNVVELALGYQSLIQQYGLTQEQVADKLGKSRPAIANTIRLLGLPKSVQEHLRAGKISQGHAKALLALEIPELIEEVAQKVLAGSVLVREIEKIARDRKKTTTDNQAAKTPKPTASEAPTPQTDSGMIDAAWGENYYREMEIALATELGRKVKITGKGLKKATLELEVYGIEDLADIAERLAGRSRY
ncbi:MAG: ParB/RepB/Spo0J family partition protein [Oscillospiraceae bacterium]|nr:ParB/RepB/Spo0J family partition protein [Oscillospiraceae bacterium]